MFTGVITIFFAAVLTHNIALSYILGMCPFISLSRNMKTASGMGFSIIFVVTVTAMINWPIYHLILVPLHSEIIAYIVFMAVIAATVQLLEMIMEKFFPVLEASFGIFLPLITVNCIVLAVSLFMVLRDYGYIKSVFFALGTSVGWTLAIVIIAALREKLRLVGDVPKGLQGPGITMIIAGTLALSFIGFSGIVGIK